jgi:hypothetical protein
MDFFYDGQIRRYVTQFMRFFIGFKYKAGDGTQTHVPVMYGDMTRQVAAIIRDNSENKMPTVPKIACYITGLELDKTRLSDATFVSKINIRERDYSFNNDGDPEYSNTYGGTYTVERLMPTPYTLKMKADIWTSNTDQKLQLLEQIAVFFNPSFEIQTTDNYIDWTSLSVIHLESVNFSSRNIPVGAESEIDICSLEFSMPIYVSPPAKVKKLGVVQNLIMNIFSDSGELESLENLTLVGDSRVQLRNTQNNYGVLLLKAENGAATDYNLSVLSAFEAVQALGLDVPTKLGQRLDWELVLPYYGQYVAGLSKVYFTQSNGTEIRGTFTINPLDPTFLVVSIEDRPSNTVIPSAYRSSGALGTIDAIINPQNFNPEQTFGSKAAIPAGTRYLMLEGINAGLRETVTLTGRQQKFDTGVLHSKVNGHRLLVNGNAVSSTVRRQPDNLSGTYVIVANSMIAEGSVVTWEVNVNEDGPDAWKNINGSDPVVEENSIIEWTGSEWITILDPQEQTAVIYVTNLRTGVQYKLEDAQWLKSFEGEYAAGYWRFEINP